MLKKILSVLICGCYAHSTAAQIYNKSAQPQALGNEFYVGKDFGKPLIKINLISGVQRPGVYHVPEGSDLAEVIAYAGGSVERADLRDITVVRKNGQSKKTALEINLERQFTRAGDMPLVADQDIVHIPVDRRMDRTMNWIGIVSGLASVALAISVIDSNARN